MNSSKKVLEITVPALPRINSVIISAQALVVPEALQSGFGLNVYLGLANFRKIACKFLSEFFQRFFPANFWPCFSGV